MPIQLQAKVDFDIEIPTAPQVQAELLKAMQASVAAVQRRAISNLSGRFARSRSGQGRRSIRTFVRGTSEGVIGSVGSPIFYLRILHSGFPVKEISVRKKGTFFTFMGGGHLITTPKVKRGLRPRPWLQAAMQDSRGDILKAFTQAADNIGRFMTGNGRAT